MLHSLLTDPQVHVAFQNLLESAAVLIGIVVGKVLVPALLQMIQTNIEKNHNALVSFVADRLVRYAEQKFEANANDKKADFVATELKAKFPGLDEEEVAHFLEAAVHSMNSSLAQSQPPAVPAQPTSGGTPS